MNLRSVTFQAYGNPQPKGSARAFVPKGWSRPIVTSANPRLKEWEALVRAAAQLHADGQFFDGPVSLAFAFYFQRPKSLAKRVSHHVKKPDLSKLVRSTEDALTGVLFRDDSQVSEVRATKHYAPEGKPSCVIVTVSEAAPPQAIEPSLFDAPSIFEEA